MKKLFVCLTAACLAANSVHARQPFVAPDADAQVAPGDVQEEGVLIDGVRWARRNVGRRGTFVSSARQRGNYYTFEEAQTACPEGWRTPTKREFESLAEAGSEWTKEKFVRGRRFGSGDRSIFLPAAGLRFEGGDKVDYRGAFGFYWASTEHEWYDRSGGNDLYFSRQGVDPGNGDDYPHGMTVRCVRR